MGNVLIDSSDRNRSILDALNMWMDSDRQRKRDNQAREMNEQQRGDQAREQRIRVAAAQLQQVHPSQRSALIKSFPPDIQSMFVDPAGLPAVPATLQQQLANAEAKKNLGIVDAFEPDPFQSRQIAQHRLTGANPSKEFTEVDAARSYMTPDVFQDYSNDGFRGRSLVAEDLAKAAESTADAKFRSGAETDAKRADIGKTRAETGKIGEETVTERTMRGQPKDGRPKPTSAENAVKEMQGRLRELQKTGDALIVEIEGVKAGAAGDTDKKRASDSGAFIKRKEAELAAVQKQLRLGIQKVVDIQTGAQRAGAKVPATEAAPAPTAPAGQPASPKVGDSKKARNGVTLYFDGTGWSPEKP